jgi:hypothetical protein
MIGDKLILKLFPKYRPFPHNFNEHLVPPFLRGARGDQSKTKQPNHRLQPTSSPPILKDCQGAHAFIKRLKFPPPIQPKTHPHRQTTAKKSHSIRKKTVAEFSQKFPFSSSETAPD